MTTGLRLLFIAVPTTFWTLVIRNELRKPRAERFGSKKWHWPAAVFGVAGMVGFYLLIVSSTPE